MKELDLISLIRSGFAVDQNSSQSSNQSSSQSLEVGPGDDCAVVRLNQPRMLVTTDMLLDETHFNTKFHSFLQIFNKTVAVNCSDIYAMGGLPTHCLVSLALPKIPPPNKMNAESIAAAYRQISKSYKVSIVGGDTNTWNGAFAISVTMFGECITDTPVLRSGAQTNDTLFVSGPLGGSLVKDRHLTPPNKRNLVVDLLKSVHINAMIDISDGLASDLTHILAASSKSCVITKNDLPIHTDCKGFHEAMCDGEDFELAFCLDEKNRVILEKTNLIKKHGLYKVGKIIDGPAQIFIRDKDKDIVFPGRGYEHS